MQSWSAQNSSPAAFGFVSIFGCSIRVESRRCQRPGRVQRGFTTLGSERLSTEALQPACISGVRRDRRDKRGGGAIADTTIRCGCDEAISASYVVAAEVRQAADAQASSALPRAAAREEATDDQHGPVRSGVARKPCDFTSRVATLSTRERGAASERERVTRDRSQARAARRAEARTSYTTTSQREDYSTTPQSGRGSRRGR